MADNNFPTRAQIADMLGDTVPYTRQLADKIPDIKYVGFEVTSFTGDCNIVTVDEANLIQEPISDDEIKTEGMIFRCPSHIGRIGPDFVRFATSIIVAPYN